MENQQLICGATDDDRKSYGSQVTSNDTVNASPDTSTAAATGPLVPLTRREIATLASLYVGTFFSATVMSLQAPLFPPLATAKGLTSLDTGIVFGVYTFLIIVMPPVTGKLTTQTSTRFVMISGCFMMSVSTLLFGFLEWSPPLATFMSLAVLLRFVEGIGFSFVISSSYVYVGAAFPSRFAPLAATIELTSAIGCSVGPALGGLLNQLGGFVTPFLVVGAAIFLSGLSLTILFDDSGAAPTDDDRPVGMFAPLKVIPVCLHAALTLTIAAVMAFNATTLTYYLQIVDPPITSSVVGLIFLGGTGAYGLTTQTTGIIFYKLKRPYILSYVGIILSAVGMAFCGPMWPIDIEPSIGLIAVSQVVTGISWGLVMPSALNLSFQESYAAGLPQGKGTNAAVSGLYISIYGIGATFGSVAGGALYNKFGYTISLTYVFGFIVLNFLFLFSVTLARRRLSVKSDRDNNIDE